MGKTANMEMVHEVLDFIDETIALYEETILYTKYHVEAKDYFRRGGCGHFYTILKAQFPQAKMYATPGLSHVVTEIDGVFYDVTGVFDHPWTSWEELVEVIPEAVELLSNYAFSVTAGITRGDVFQGPTGATFLQTLAAMDSKKRDICFEFIYQEMGEDAAYFYRHELKKYLNPSANKRYIKQLFREAQGVIYPFTPESYKEVV